MLVATTISSLIAAMVISITLVNRSLYQKDLGRTLVNENLRAAVSIIGSEIRQAGERFPASFPAILIINGSGSNPDELVLRRNLLNQVIVGCDNKTAGSSYNRSPLSRSSATTAVCTSPNQATNYNAWRNYVTGLGGQQPIYIFNQTTRNGEFLNLLGSVGSTSSGVQYINYTNKRFTHSYTQEYTSIYMINEWRIRLNAGILQVIVNDDASNPQNIIAGISGFQVNAVMQDGTTQDALVSTDNWTLVSRISVTLTGTEQLAGRQSVSRTVTAEFFPRNILSN